MCKSDNTQCQSQSVLQTAQGAILTFPSPPWSPHGISKDLIVLCLLLPPSHLVTLTSVPPHSSGLRPACPSEMRAAGAGAASPTCSLRSRVSSSPMMVPITPHTHRMNVGYSSALTRQTISKAMVMPILPKHAAVIFSQCRPEGKNTARIHTTHEPLSLNRAAEWAL
jgi:hypothetical protein